MKTIFKSYYENICENRVEFLINYRDNLLDFISDSTLENVLYEAFEYDSSDTQFEACENVFSQLSTSDQSLCIDGFLNIFFDEEELEELNNLFFINKLKEKVIPDLKGYLHIKDVYKIETERLDLYYAYYEELPFFNDGTNVTASFSHIMIDNYLPVVAYIKGTNEYVGYFEISQYYEVHNPKVKITNIPWMFLSTNPVDYRRQGYMAEMLENIIGTIRIKFPFFENETIYSGNSLSDNAISFFENMKLNGLAEKTKKKNYPEYKLKF